MNTGHPDTNDTTTSNPISSVGIAAEVGACWMSRGRGMPPVDGLRREVWRRHGEAPCDWCDYPAAVLIDWLEEWTPDQDAAWRPGWQVPTLDARYRR